MKLSEFLTENFQFLVMKFSLYLNRRVFVINCLSTYTTIAIDCKRATKAKNELADLGLRCPLKA